MMWRKHCNAGGVRGDKAFVRWGAKATLIPITAHLALATVPAVNESASSFGCTGTYHP